MNVSLDSILWNVLRTSIGLSVAAILIGALLRVLRVRSPRVEQVVRSLVLMQGLLLVQVPIFVPAHWFPGFADTGPLVAIGTIRGTGGLTSDATPTSSVGQPVTLAPDDTLADASIRKQQPDSAMTATKTANLSWLSAACCIWLAGIATIFSVGLFRYWWLLQRLTRTGDVQNDWADEWKQLLAQYRITTSIPLIMTHSFGPALVRWPGGFRLVVPLDEWNQLTSIQRLAILRHELAHFRRGDVWTALAARSVAVLHWFNPCAWWAVHCFEAQSEFLCDQFASGENSLDFADALIQLGTSRTPAMIASQSARHGSLTDRVRRLLNDSSRTSRWSGTSILVLAAIILLPAAVRWQPKLVAQEERTRSQNASANSPSGTPAAASPTPADPATVGKGQIEGLIELIDGSPATIRGSMYYHTRNQNSSLSGLDNHYRDRFLSKVPGGTVSLVYSAEGYAPVSVGPFELNPGETIRGVTIVLKRGFSRRVRVLDVAGHPIDKARLSITPWFNNASVGYAREFQSNDQGECLIEHLAETIYSVQVHASGFEVQRIAKQEFNADAPLIVTLNARQLTTGRVFDTDGTPAANASLFLIHEIDQDGHHHVMSSDPTAIATTDPEGQFELNDLTQGSDYLMAISRSDGGGVIRHDIKAGQHDLKITIPPRRSLKVQVTGDLSQLPQRDGKPFVHIRQWIHFQPTPSRQHGCLVSADVPIRSNSNDRQGPLAGALDATGGEAFLEGVLIDESLPNRQTIQVAVGNLDQFTKIVELNLAGETNVRFELPAIVPKPEIPVENARNYIVIPWKKTELQDWIVGSAGEPREDNKAYVLVDGNSLYSRDGRLDQDALDWEQLAKRLAPLADRKRGIVLFHTYHFNFSASSKDLMGWAFKGFGEQRAGFHKAYVSQTFGGPGDFWNMIEAAVQDMKGRTEGLEQPIGDELIQIFPIQTLLSNVVTGQADCVIRIVPRLTSDTKESLPQGIQASILRYVPKIDVPRHRKLIFVLNFESDAQRTVDWFSEKGAGELARQLNFENGYVNSARYSSTKKP